MYFGVLYIFIFRAFDVEMLYLAQSLGMPIKEVAVEWNEIEGWFSLSSKVEKRRIIPHFISRKLATCAWSPSVCPAGRIGHLELNILQ